MLERPQLHSLTDSLLIDTLQLQVRVYHVKEVGGLILVYQWILYVNWMGYAGKAILSA